MGEPRGSLAPLLNPFLGCGAVSARPMLPHVVPSHTQRLEGRFELKTSGRCWEVSDLRGNGHGRARFRKGRKCTSGLAGVTGSRQRSALLCENLAEEVRSWCFPMRHLPSRPRCTNPGAGPQPYVLLEAGSDAGKRPGSVSVQEKSVLCCFASLVMNCWDEKIFSLLLNPCAPPGWKSRFQQDEIWDAIRHRALRSRAVPIPVPSRRSQPGFGQTQPTHPQPPAGDAVHSNAHDEPRDYEIFSVALMQLESPARGR